MRDMASRRALARVGYGVYVPDSHPSPFQRDFEQKDFEQLVEHQRGLADAAWSLKDLEVAAARQRDFGYLKVTLWDSDPLQEKASDAPALERLVSEQVSTFPALDPQDDYLKIVFDS